jgi:hypothetical protein
MQHACPIDEVTSDLGLPRLTTAEARGHFVSGPGTHVLFIPDHPEPGARTLEAARILPEICTTFSRVLDCAVIDPSIASETCMAVGVDMAPSLVFFRDGLQIGALPGIGNRPDHMARIAQILAVKTDPAALARAED